MCGFKDGTIIGYSIHFHYPFPLFSSPFPYGSSPYASNCGTTYRKKENNYKKPSFPSIRWRASKPYDQSTAKRRRKRSQKDILRARQFPSLKIFPDERDEKITHPSPALQSCLQKKASSGTAMRQSIINRPKGRGRRTNRRKLVKEEGFIKTSSGQDNFFL